MNSFSLWIIGPSGSGKSTLAKRLSAEIGMEVLEAGRFARGVAPEGAGAAELADVSAKLLRRSHRHFSWLILKNVYRHRKIVVGVRNPVDFLDAFDPHTDRVLILDAGREPASEFERAGLAAIDAILKFFLATGIIENIQAVTLKADKEKGDWYAETHS